MKWGRMALAGRPAGRFKESPYGCPIGRRRPKKGSPQRTHRPRFSRIPADTIKQIEIQHRGEDPVTVQLNASGVMGHHFTEAHARGL